MSDQRDDQRSNNACLLTIMFLVAILLSMVVGGIAGTAISDGQQQRQVTIYPDIPVDPETLHVVPSVQTFVDPVLDNCDNVDPTAPIAGWEKGVGGQLPPCWSEWDRIQQNAFRRSH